MTENATPAPTAPPGGPLRRAWGAPMWAHVVALALVLVAAAAVVGTQASFSADEGAVITQARALADGGGWIVEHPVPQVDPDGVLYPLELSARGTKGVAPFAKHPLYALILAGAYKVGGVPAMVGLSVLGTLLAAMAAAAVARRLGGPTLARPALWAGGLGSPLFFDSNLVIAHTLGAAACGAAVLVALVALDRRRPALAAPVAILVAVAVLFRTEALLLGLALAAAAALVALRDRPLRPVAAAIAAASLGAALLTTLVETWWADVIVGGPLTTTPGGTGATAGLVDGRLHAFQLTWLQPSYDGGAVEVALVAMAAAVALAVYAARRRPHDGGPIRLLATVAAATSVLALAVGPTNIVPGLLVACPVLLAGLLSTRRDACDGAPMALVGGTCAGFAVAVLATQYSTGGSGEWGGRYFAVGLALAIPAALVFLRRTADHLQAGVVRHAAGALAVCGLSLAVMAVGGLRHTHRFTGDLVAAVDRAALTIDDPRPVILTTEPPLPRSAWATFERQRWLLTRSDDLSGIVGSLRRTGITEIALVSGRPVEDLARQLGPEARVVSADAWAETVGWRVLVLELG